MVCSRSNKSQVDFGIAHDSRYVHREGMGLLLFLHLRGVGDGVLLLLLLHVVARGGLVDVGVVRREGMGGLLVLQLRKSGDGVLLLPLLLLRLVAQGGLMSLVGVDEGYGHAADVAVEGAVGWGSAAATAAAAAPLGDVWWAGGWRSGGWEEVYIWCKH